MKRPPACSWGGFDRAALAVQRVFACVCRGLGGLGGITIMGHTDPLVSVTFPQQKHHSQRKGGRVGEWAKECVRVQHKRTVKAPRPLYHPSAGLSSLSLKRT